MNLVEPIGPLPQLRLSWNGRRLGNAAPTSADREDDALDLVSARLLDERSAFLKLWGIAATPTNSSGNH